MHTIDIPMTCAFPADVDPCNSLKLRIVLLADGWIKTKRNIPGPRIWLNVCFSKTGRISGFAPNGLILTAAFHSLCWVKIADVVESLTISQKTQEYDLCPFNAHKDDILRVCYLSNLAFTWHVGRRHQNSVFTCIMANAKMAIFKQVSSTLVSHGLTKKKDLRSLMLPQAQLGHSSIRYFQFWYHYVLEKVEKYQNSGSPKVPFSHRFFTLPYLKLEEPLSTTVWKRFFMKP